MIRPLLALSMIASITACSAAPGLAPAGPQFRQPLQRMSAPLQRMSTGKAESDAVKQGEPTDLQAVRSKGERKNVAPAPSMTVESPEPIARSASRSHELQSIANIGLRAMDRARSWEDGYNIGYETLRSLARDNVYIARLGLAAAKPAMKYESAYKVVAHALRFVAEGQEISIYSAVTLIGSMMDSAKSWEDGARIGYSTMEFINETAQPHIRSVIHAAVRSARAAEYWEDAYHILFDAYAQIRNM